MAIRKMKKYSSKRKIKNKTKNKSRKQKIWMMKGCAHSHLAKCKKCMQRGGQCNACGLQQGGYNPVSQVPGPFIGQAWTPKISGWPGVNGVGGDRNYLSQNLYKQDPQLMMKLGGRKKRRKTRKTRKGGGLIPQDLVNLGRDISYNLGSTYNALAGYPQPVNPLPYKQPQLSRESNII
jgi:hypothetical protein